MTLLFPTNVFWKVVFFNTTARCHCTPICKPLGYLPKGFVKRLQYDVDRNHGSFADNLWPMHFFCVVGNFDVGSGKLTPITGAVCIL